MSEIKCPKCGSTQLTASKKGFSGKQAVAGAILTGGIGLLAGTLGSNKVRITCLACGHVFKPGEGAVTSDPNQQTETEKKFLSGEISDFDNSIIATIKSQGKIAAIKEVVAERKVELDAAKAVVDRLIREHNITSAAPSGCAGVIIFLVIAGFMLYFII